LMSSGTLLQAFAPGLSVMALALLGFGVSLAIPSLLTSVVGSAPPELAGTAGGALNASRQTGAALGVAILGALPTVTVALLVAAILLAVGAVISAMITD
jgi:DHA2 family methylenomycin A resistance protein-like MFS transporter